MKPQPKLLIVEDDSILRHIYTRILENSAYEVLVAKNGMEGLEVAKKIHPDCMLIDLLMPHLEGTELLSKLKHEPWYEECAVFVMSNISDKLPASFAKTHNVQAVINKIETSPDELLRIINESAT